ncbi:MAG: FliH/SctL family protein [Acidimicrobiales bacterium]
MNSSTDPRFRTRVLRVAEGNVTTTLPDELDLSTYAAAGSQSIVSPEMVGNAIESGYRDGWDEGFNQARTAVEQAAAAERDAWLQEQGRRLGSALDALASAVVEFQIRRTLDLTNLEDHVATAAFDLAAALLGRELELTRSPGRDAVARALALAPPNESLVVRLNPADVETLGSIEDLLPGRRYQVLSDPSVESGGCLLDAKDSQVDARLTTAMARARQAMLDEPGVGDGR